MCTLIQISVASLLWNIHVGKHCRPISYAILFSRVEEFRQRSLEGTFSEMIFECGLAVQKETSY